MRGKDKTMNHFKAKNLKEAATPRQLAAIRAIANKQQVNADELCRRLRGCEPHELRKRAASTFIQFLNSDDSKVLECQLKTQKRINEIAAESAV
jgi:hypothetical protein